MRNCTNSDKGKEKLYMKKMRKGAAVLLLLLSLCVPAVDVSADVRNEPAEYTVEYIARDGETETLLARETYRAPAGRTVNVPHREFDNYVKEAGQDMTLPVTADGKAVLNLYYDREIWTINLHEEADHEYGSSDSLISNDDIWYTAQGKYGAALPEEPEIPKEPETTDAAEVPEKPEIPDTGDRAPVAVRLAMTAAAAGTGWIVLLCVRRKLNL